MSGGELIAKPCTCALAALVDPSTAADLKLVSPAFDTVAVPLESAQAATPSIGTEPLRHGLNEVLQTLITQAQPDLLGRVEETLVRAAFSHTGSNQVRTARVLGVTRNTWRTLLKRYGLLSPSGEPTRWPADPPLWRLAI